VKELHDSGMHYIPILDLGLAQRGEGYDAYSDGAAKKTFIMTEGGEVFTG